MTTSTNPEIVMSSEEIQGAVRRIAGEILEAHPDGTQLALLGILRRGKPLADRIANELAAATGNHPPVGALATTLYRDDLRSGKGRVKIDGRETHFDFDVDGIDVILVDDVIYSGRTIRAALDEVMDYGRPSRIQLACLVDRGLRELPIQADYLGLAIKTLHSDHVAVHLMETDEEDVVLLQRSPE